MTIAPRVAFRERQRLFAADLTAEQEYRLGLAGRHLLAAHDWGVVSLSKPGYAIDGYGRELPHWAETAPAVGEPNVWVYYCEQPVQPQRPCEGSALARTEQRALARPSAKDDLDPAGTENQNARVARVLGGRAAGPAPDAPPWPVAVQPTAKVHYTSLSAASLTDVQRVAKLQIGKTATTDPFYIVIWQNPGIRRYAADRTNSQLWGDLLISATRKAALFTISAGKFVEIEEKEPGASFDLQTALRETHAKLNVQASPLTISPDPIWNRMKDKFSVRTVTINGLREIAPDFQDVNVVASVNLELLLVPSALPPAVAAKRQIVAVRPQDPNAAAPIQIQCGPRQDSDFSTRFSVIGSAAGRVDGLSVSGEGSVRIGGTVSPKGDPRNLIFVNGTLELPPVKASILDPLFNPLLVLTYIAGLRRANSFGAAWLSGTLAVPARVGVGEDFIYSLVLTPHTPATVQTTHLLERFRLNDGTSIQDARTESPTVANVQTTVSLPVNHFSLAEAGDRVTIEMEMAIKVGQAQSSVVVPASNPIVIEEPPLLKVEIDLDVDDFVPLGTAWNYTVKTQDRPGRLSMQQLTVADGVNALPATDVSTLPPSKNFNYPVSNAPKVVDIAATLVYQWQGNAAPSAPKTIKNKIHVGGMQLELKSPLQAGVNQSVQFEFTNISGATIENIRNLKVDVTNSAGTSVGGFTNGSPRTDLSDTESTLLPLGPKTIDLTGQAAGSVLTVTVTYGLTRLLQAYPRQTHILTVTLL